MDCPCLDCFLTTQRREEVIKKRQIDKVIKEVKLKQKTQIKLLLLGTGESGKSTFIRQMRILYDNGFSDEEKRQHVAMILENIHTSTQILIEAMDLLRIPYANKSNLSNANVIKATDYEAFVRLPEMYAEAIKELWNDDGVQECYRRRREYQLTDSIKYYMENIDRIADQFYVPTEDDIVHVRVPTTGIVERVFKVKGSEFLIVDVGGQRSERRKWLHCFDKVKAIIFLTAISEYDQVLKESDPLNRLVESINVFNNISNSKWFITTPIVLFFNKEDLLRDKIMYSDLTTFFPDYKGPKHDHLAAREFIQEMFTKLVYMRPIYKHFTCATDTNNIDIVFLAVRDVILSEHLNRFGIF